MRRTWNVLVGALAVAGGALAGQVELVLPATVTVRTAAARQVELGVHAVDPVEGLALGGTRLASRMPTEGTLLLMSDGTGLLSYHDLFLRRWRGRRPEATLDGEFENLLDPPAGWVPPKVVRDLWRVEAGALAMPLESDELCWVGQIAWRFQPGLPITGLAFTEPSGRRRTTVGYCDPEAMGSEIAVSVSADGVSWTEVWRGAGEIDPVSEEPPLLAVTGELPSELAGATELYVRFEGTGASLYDLYVTLVLDAASVTGQLAVPAGESELAFSASSGAGPVIVFWPGNDLTVVSGTGPAPTAPEVEVDAARVRIRFPSGGELALCRGPGGGITGPCEARQGTVELLAPPPGWEPPGALVMLDGGPIPGYEDWVAEAAAYKESQVWPSAGTRERRDLPLAAGQLLGTEVRPDGTVAVRCRVVDGERTGTLTWEARPASWAVAGRVWRGVAWRVVLEGLEAAERLRVVEPVTLHAGWWWIEQVFRGITDEAIDFATPYELPPVGLFGGSQSFRFAAGEDGAELARFVEPTMAAAEVREELGRRMVGLEIPLGRGTVRATPWRQWLAAEGVTDAWAARDLWAWVYDGVAEDLAARHGLRLSRPRPTLVWNQPSPAYYEAWAGGARPPEGGWWLDTFRDTILPRAAAVGIRTVYIQPPWENDAERGANAWSAHAPVAFRVSPALGGEERLKAAIGRAHELGIRVVLWYPSSFSLDAEIFLQHPERVPFRRDGTPENGGWPDVVGVDLESAHLPETLATLAGLHGRVGFDGLWLDSWEGLTLLTDYRKEQPAPQLGAALRLLRGMWEMGIDEVITEGLTPFAAGDAYGDYESHEGPPQRFPRVERELETVRGREHLLYRIKAAVLLDGEVYFRTLAAGGMVGVQNLDEIDALEAADRSLLERANRAFAALEPLMVRRSLEVRDGTWVGVRWYGETPGEEALYAFAAFDVPLPPGARVRDVVTGADLAPGTVLRTEPWHAYRIVRPAARGGPAERARPAGTVPAGRSLKGAGG